MDIVFVNVNIFDGSGAPSFPGELLVHNQRIALLARDGERVPRAGARVIDGHGATLMPGLTEGHAHLTWPNSIETHVPGMSLPVEDLTLTAARNARILLDHGFTSAYSAGALNERLEVVLRAHIDAGGLPGPRLVPASMEREPPATDTPLDAGAVGAHGTGPDAISAFVRDCAALGAKTIKFMLSGENALMPGASQRIMYNDQELRAAAAQAEVSDVWLSGHAHACAAIKLGVSHGFRVLYHCTEADSEALDLIEARKQQLFIGPSIGIVQATLDATPPPHFDMTYLKQDAARVLERQQALVPELKRRGVRLVPGGDYGFVFNPIGRNARDLELWVRHFGYTPAEALHAATGLGGELMGRAQELGLVREGYFADLLLVDGDPTRDVRLLQDKRRLLGIMKDGRFHKDPLLPL